MSLMARINAMLLPITVLALGVFYVLGSHLLEINARRGLLREASLMLDSAAATRRYTTEEILPLLTGTEQQKFLPQSIPFYAATQNFLHLREQHPEYSYKEATLNPTNPRDRALEWEADIIQRFRDDGAAQALDGERDTPLGRVLFLARPIRVSAECLECHGDAVAAPKALIARYGANNGFGWSSAEVVGAQVVAVPIAGALQDARRTLLQFSAVVGGACVVLIVTVNVLVYRIVVLPLRGITATAELVSKGRPSVQFVAASSGDFALLIAAFERMRISLDKAMKLLAR